MISQRKYIIGIDLGTTNTCVAVVENGTPVVLVNDAGSRTTPSIVSFTDNDTTKNAIGLDAINQKYGNVANTIYEAKRLIGLSYKEYKSKASEINLHFNVVEGKNGEAAVKLSDGRIITPIDVAAQVLGECKRFACKHLGMETTQELSAIVTVPAYFNDDQRQATKDAGRIAGLNIERIINEPTAAALAYAKQKLLNKTSANVAIYDFGGGTFDVSIVELSVDLESGSADTMVEVKSTNGDTNLGGALIDEKLYDYLKSNIEKTDGLHFGDEPVAKSRVKEVAENIKKELSFKPSSNASMPFLGMVNNRPVSPSIDVSRSTLESFMESIVDKTIECCKKALADAHLTVSDIDYVVLVGGSTRIPLVQSKVEKFFGKKPKSDINPDEVVAIGAAIQGSVLTGDVKDLLLVDVTPLTLGIETQGGILTPLITRNSQIPVNKKQVFSTAEDNQTAVTISLYQGERPMARDNHPLGQFNLDGIAPAPRGMPQIEVCIDIDVNGIISVSAMDKATNKKNHITISGDSKLSEEQIAKMEKEYKENQAADEQRRKLAESKNNLQNALYQSDKLTTGENSSKLLNDDKEKLTKLVDECKKLLSDDVQELSTLDAKSDELNKLCSEIGQKIHSSANTNDTASSDTDNTPQNDMPFTDSPHTPE